MMVHLYMYCVNKRVHFKCLYLSLTLSLLDVFPSLQAQLSGDPLWHGQLQHTSVRQCGLQHREGCQQLDRLPGCVLCRGSGKEECLVHVVHVPLSPPSTHVHGVDYIGTLVPTPSHLTLSSPPLPLPHPDIGRRLG